MKTKKQNKKSTLHDVVLELKKITPHIKSLSEQRKYELYRTIIYTILGIPVVFIGGKYIKYKYSVPIMIVLKKLNDHMKVWGLDVDLDDKLNFLDWLKQEMGITEKVIPVPVQVKPRPRTWFEWAVGIPKIKPITPIVQMEPVRNVEPVKSVKLPGGWYGGKLKKVKKIKSKK